MYKEAVLHYKEGEKKTRDQNYRIRIRKVINNFKQVCTVLYKKKFFLDVSFYLYSVHLINHKFQDFYTVYRNKDISGAGMKGRMSSPNN